MTKRVLHIASFNGNIGDNANHNGLRNKLEEYFGFNLQYDEVEMREFYKSWDIRDFNSKSFIDLSNSYDLVIIGGGNFFELKWDYSHTGTTVNLSEETLQKIKTPIFFFGLGCDVAKGASQSAIRKFEKFLKIITNSSKYFVTVRNDGSLETIQNLYGTKYDGKVHKVSDGAFFMTTKPRNYPELNQSMLSVGINIVSDMKDIRFNDNYSYEEFIKDFSKVINQFLAENPRYQVIFFPHIYSDLEAIYKLLEHINDNFRRTRIVVAPLLTGKGAEDYIFGLYKECEFILGMRFHSNICAIAQNIPTIALSSYKKIHDLYSELNLKDRIVYVNKRGFEKHLYKKIENTISNQDAIRQLYGNLNERINKINHNFYKMLVEWAKNSNVI